MTLQRELCELFTAPFRGPRFDRYYKPEYQRCDWIVGSRFAQFLRVSFDTNGISVTADDLGRAAMFQGDLLYIPCPLYYDVADFIIGEPFAMRFEELEIAIRGAQVRFIKEMTIEFNIVDDPYNNGRDFWLKQYAANPDIEALMTDMKEYGNSAVRWHFIDKFGEYEPLTKDELSAAYELLDVEDGTASIRSAVNHRSVEFEVLRPFDVESIDVESR